MTIIPMLSHYSKQFNFDGHDMPAGRKGRIFSMICAQPFQTRKKIAEDTGIRPATVSKLVLNLIETGLVEESRPEEISQKGRPEIVLSPIVNRLVALVGYTVSRTIHCAAVNLAGEVLHVASEKTVADSIDPDRFITIMEALYHECMINLPKGAQFAGYSISLPGIVNETEKKWVYSIYWPKLLGLDLNVLEQKLQTPVGVRKNLNCELHARFDKRLRQKTQSMVLVHWGLGIGAAYVCEQENGRRSSLGEIGHCCVDQSSTAVCKCGMVGCVEAEAGLWALKQKSSDPDMPIDERRFQTYLDQKDNEQDYARQIELMALTLRNVVLTLTPDEIVLTGPFTHNEAIFKRLLAAFENALPPNSLITKDMRPQIVAGDKHNADELIGAAAHHFSKRLGELCAD